MLLQEYFTLGGCAGLDIYNIFVYLNVIARIFHFGRVCWSWYLQYFCIFECYCKNISLWEGVLVLISTIFLYIWLLLQEYFTLGGCAGLESTISLYTPVCILHVIARIFHFGRVCWSWYLQYFCIFECYCKNISLWEGVLVLISTIFLYIWMLLQEYFTLGGCAGLDIYNIFVYLNVIARIFHFGRVCWSWYLQYFCIFECYCKNISLWEGVLVLISTIFLYIWLLLQEYFTLGGCAGLKIYNIFVYLYIGMLLQEYFTLGGCAGLDIYNIFVYLNVIARIFHFGRVCWS